MKNLILPLALFMTLNLTAQVGIGTTAPNAALDIRSSNEATPTNTDGILIPKIDAFPLTPPTTAQDGMLVYVTGDGALTKGYYYWDNTNTTWQTALGSGATKINELTDGKSDSDGSNDGSSIFFGISAGANDDQTDNGNSGLGYFALSANTSGIANTAMGYASLWKNNIGNLNTAIGARSMYENTSGVNNTAVGQQSLENNQSGSNNVALGQIAMFENVTGQQNTALGRGAGYNVLGSANTFIGFSAGYNETGSNKLYIENSTADANNALIYGEFDNNILRTNGELQIGNPASGGYALPTADGAANQLLSTDGNGQLTFASVSGSGATKVDELTDGVSGASGSSIFLGLNAGISDDGTNNSNTALGQNALSSNTEGFQNAALGALALNDNIDGDRNSAFGYDALGSNTTGGWNTALGNVAMFSNISGDRNTSVGFRALGANTTANNNTAIGYQSLITNVDGSANTALGYYSGRLNVSGAGNVFVGNGAGHNTLGSSNIMLGSGAGYNETGSNTLYIENSITTTPLIYGTFNTNEVGINWDSSVALPNTLSVNGNASKSTSGSWLANSDRRLKKEIKTIAPQDALLKIMSLRGVTYKWNDTQTGIDRPTTVQYGFIAQELMEVFPDKVTEDGQGFYQTAYGDYDALFVQAIKELKQEIQEKDAVILQLKELFDLEVENLQAQLNDIKATLEVTNQDTLVSKN